MEYLRDGSPITCDGCNAPVETIREDMKHPAPADLYGPNALYLVCSPLPSGEQPCLVLAQLADEIWRRTACFAAGCDGARCQD